MEMEMEEYLKNMRSLRSQMNDIEDEAVKMSVEEQKQRTAINALVKDLDLVKTEAKRLNEEVEEIGRARAQVCSQIVDKQKQIVSFEVESATLCKTLDLLQQEIVSLSTKLEDKRTYYAKILEDLNAKLLGQQVARSTDMEMYDVEENLNSGRVSLGVKMENMGGETGVRYKDLSNQIESAKAELEELMAKKSETQLLSNKSKQMIEQLNQKSVPSELSAMDMEALKEEHKALLADKAGETEYLNSLKDQIKQLEGISDIIKCQCGKEYKVDLMD